MCSVVFKWTSYNAAYTLKAAQDKMKVTSHKYTFQQKCGIQVWHKILLKMHIRSKLWYITLSCIWMQSRKLKAHQRSLPFSIYACSVHRLSSPCNWFTSWLSYGKQWSYPDYRHFLPPPFTAMPGMAAVFTQAWSGKLQIPHPHGICIMGYKGQGFLGE